MAGLTINVPHAAQPFVGDKRFVDATANAMRSWCELRDAADELPQEEGFAARDRAKAQFYDYMLLFLTRLNEEGVPFKPTDKQAAMMGQGRDSAFRIPEIAKGLTWYLAFCVVKDD